MDKYDKIKNFQDGLYEQYGSHLISLLFAFYEDKNILVLESIFLKQESRRNGLGTEIMEKICAFADANNYEVFLEIDPFSNVPKKSLIEFYSRFGFKKNYSKKISYQLIGFYRRKMNFEWF